MEIKKVTDASFRKYGRVLTGIDYRAVSKNAGDAVSGGRHL